jgi:hypothetical protein
MSDETSAPEAVRERVDGHGLFSGYSPHEHRPLKPYAVMTSAFAAAFAGGLLASERSGRPLPDHVGTRDLLLAGVATHKVSRLIAKDRVTSFLRAPFTRYQEPAGPGEVSEEARGDGLRQAVGELLGCPYCLGQWVAAAFSIGLVAAPRPTRLVAAMYAAETVADFLQLAYLAAEKRASE